MCNPQSGEIQEQEGGEVFCGSVKSFNSRRGFGFLSCEETASRFGRDVYLSKEEVMVLAAEPEVGEATAADKDDKKAPAPVQEGDILLFHVKLSTEGFPQAVQVKKMRRLRGVVQQAPSSTTDGIIIVNGDGSDKAEDLRQKPDAALQQLLGASVQIRNSECGQLKLLPNDEVEFCCVSVSDSGRQAWEAQLLDVISLARVAGSVLGCFSLQLPKLVTKNSPEDEHAWSNVDLQGHAVTDCVFLSKVPSNVSSSDLMRLFSQLGGKDAQVTSGNGYDTLGYASVFFNGPDNVAKFLMQTTHTVSESGVTRLAHVGPCPHRTRGSVECICASRGAANKEIAFGSMETTSMANHNAQPQVTTKTPWPSAVNTAPTMSEPICSPSACTRMPLLDAVFPESNQAPQVQNYTINCAPSPTPVIAATATVPDWRCVHRNILVVPAAPEILVAGDNNGCSLCIQWPTVVHASAYVVELLNQSTMTYQRYLHAMPDGQLPFLMDLRVDHLQPSAYAVSVRCLAPCGCESTASAWSMPQPSPMASMAPMAPIQLLGSMAPMAPSMQLLQPLTPSAVMGTVPPPPSAPPSLPMTSTMQHPEADSALPAIPEESLEGGMSTGLFDDEILTLD